MEKQIIREIDYLRISAFLAVVLQHVLGLYQRYSIFKPLDNYVIGLVFGMAKFAVPMFVFISGFVLFHNYYNHLHYLKFLKKRFFYIVIPYILWSLFYMNYPLTDIKSINIELQSLLKNLLLGSAKYHLWYVAMICQGFIVLPIIFWSYHKIEMIISNQKTFIFAFSGFAILYILYTKNYYSLLTYVNNETIQYLLTRIFSISFTSYIFYFIFGGIIALNYEKFIMWIKHYKITILVVTLVTYIMVEFYALSRVADKITFDDFGSFNVRFFLLSLMSILLLYNIAIKIVKFNKITVMVKKASRFTYGAYLSHAFIITYIYNLMIPLGLSHTVFYSLLFILSTIISLIFGGIGYYIYEGLFLILKRISNRNKKQCEGVQIT